MADLLCMAAARQWQTPRWSMARSSGQAAGRAVRAGLALSLCFLLKRTMLVFTEWQKPRLAVL